MKSQMKKLFLTIFSILVFFLVFLLFFFFVGRIISQSVVHNLWNILNKYEIEKIKISIAKYSILN